MPKQLNRYEKIWLATFSILFGIGVVLTKAVYPAAHDKNNFLNYNLDVFTVFNFLIFVVTVPIVYSLVVKLYKWVRYKSPSFIDSAYLNNTTYKRIAFWGSFFACLFFWGICYLTYFPGAGMNDTIDCIDVLLRAPLQPAFYQIIVYEGMKFFRGLFQNATMAYGVIILLQMLLSAAVVSRFIAWLAQKGIKKAILAAASIYFACMPLIADYTISLLKDTWFAYAMLLLIPPLYDILYEKKRICAKTKCIFLLACLLLTVSRSNGLFVVVPFSILLVIFAKSHRRFVVIVLLLALIVNQWMSYLQNSTVSFREAISVPMAQIGAVLNMDGTISEEDAQVINQILPSDIWKEKYSFSFVDPIKFNEHFDNQYLNENKFQFLKVWFSLLKKNINLYVKAYLYHSYGFWELAFWDIDKIDKTQSIFTKVNNNITDDSRWGEYIRQIGLQNKPIWGETIASHLNAIYLKAFRYNLHLSMGVLFWILVCCGILLVTAKKWVSLLVLSPLALTWISSMIASPSSLIYRYGFFLVLTLPFVLLYTYFQLRSIQKIQN
ncbi:hypothetical protein JQM64_10595 [Fournierella massiliensis]|nr:DUF6020 family protein [Fournierella massiliensis]MCF2557958.1 hypothetical protein [Fournierella massiliensis]